LTGLSLAGSKSKRGKWPMRGRSRQRGIWNKKEQKFGRRIVLGWGYWYESNTKLMFCEWCMESSNKDSLCLCQGMPQHVRVGEFAFGPVTFSPVLARMAWNYYHFDIFKVQTLLITKFHFLKMALLVSGYIFFTRNKCLWSQPVGEIRISRYFSRKNVTFRQNVILSIKSFKYLRFVYLSSQPLINCNRK
jgi:hypothetical protein